MKFQKVLIALYLLVQIFLLICLNDIAQLTTAYIIITGFTLAAYLAVCIKDPGYIIVEEINMDIQERQATDFAQIQPIDNDNGKQIVSMRMAAGMSNLQNINQNINRDHDKLSEFDSNLKHLGFSKKKLGTKRDTLYCGICMINQPYRTKHCHQCEKCVATHDHHCPWIANCVGQKNRHYFFTFLICQMVQVFLAAVYVCSQAVNKIIPIKTQWILGVTLILFLSVITGLTIFHAYLMASNVTTWEMARWDRIPYLSKYQRTNGSPFSKGPLRNVVEYWVWGFRTSRKIWEFQH